MELSVHLLLKIYMRIKWSIMYKPGIPMVGTQWLLTKLWEAVIMRIILDYVSQAPLPKSPINSPLHFTHIRTHAHTHTTLHPYSIIFHNESGYHSFLIISQVIIICSQVGNHCNRLFRSSTPFSSLGHQSSFSRLRRETQNSPAPFPPHFN
jgi:hypothetical protein